MVTRVERAARSSHRAGRQRPALMIAMNMIATVAPAIMEGMMISMVLMPPPVHG